MRSIIITLIIAALTLNLVSAARRGSTGRNSQRCKVYKEPEPVLACPACADTKDPVCGWNGKCGTWFQNSCLLLSYNCYQGSKKRMMTCDSNRCTQLCK